VAALVTRHLKPVAAAQQGLAAVATAVLEQSGAIYMPEGCPLSAVANATGRRCLDTPAVQYLVALAEEYALRGGFELVFPPVQPQPDFDQLQRLAAMIIAGEGRRCDPLVDPQQCAPGNFQLTQQLLGLVAPLLAALDRQPAA
jgi:hypothetical protein